MSDQKEKTSWDDLAESLGAGPPSQAAQVRHSEPATDSRPEKPSLPPSTRPRTPPPKLGGWGTLASELGLSMPAATTPDVAESSKTQPREIGSESSQSDRKLPCHESESEPAASQPHGDDGSIAVDDSSGAISAEASSVDSEPEGTQGEESNHGPPKERKRRRRRGRRRPGSKEDGSDQLEGSPPSPTDLTVKVPVETDESESALDDSTGDEAAFTQKRRRRGRGRGRRQKSTSGETADLYAPRSTDWLEESQDAADNDATDNDATDNDTDSRDPDESVAIQHEIRDHDRSGDAHSDAATGGDSLQTRLQDRNSAEPGETPDVSLGKKRSLDEKGDARRPRRRRGGRRRGQTSGAGPGLHESEPDAQDAGPETERSRVAETVDWSDDGAAESGIGYLEEMPDETPAKGASHKNIPSWEEAIVMIVETNLGNRTSARGRSARGGSKGHSRGRGRRN